MSKSLFTAISAAQFQAFALCSAARYEILVLFDLKLLMNIMGDSLLIYNYYFP